MQGPEMSSTTAPSRSATTSTQRQVDPNAPQNRLFLNQQCIYERRLPGDSYVTAHITRLQSGYYDTPAIHEDRINDVRFLAINFVFHPVDTTHRFISARITLSVHDKDTEQDKGLPLLPQLDPSPRKSSSLTDPNIQRKPKILRYAPHLLYGTLSPETLDWNFNLAGSLGVTQGPANASLQPSGGVKSSYKVYKMMKIQGSVRTLASWYGREKDVEDGELVWTLEENSLQKSGLPREFTFVVMLTKGHSANNVRFNIDIEPVVASWYGHYPNWWLNRIWYKPLPKAVLDLDKELGQKFQPTTKKEGFNFANLMGRFDDFVSLPGTTYSASDAPPTAPPPATDNKKANKPQTAAPQQPQPLQNIFGGATTASPGPDDPKAPDKSKDLNIRVFLEGYHPTIHQPRNVASAHSLSSRSSLPIQSTSPLPETGFSISKSRSRPSSAIHQSLPSASNKPTANKPRPTSAIYEPSTTPPMASNHSTSQQLQKQRPLSGETDFSEDLYIQPISPPLYDAPTPPRTSKSLRHRRSRSGLTEEFSSPENRQKQRVAPPEQPNVNLRRSNTSARKSTNEYHPPSSFQTINSNTSTYPSSGSLAAQGKRSHRTKTDTQPPPSIDMSSTPKSNLNRQSISDRSTTTDKNTTYNSNSNNTTTPSYPPTSYPAHSMNSSTTATAAATTSNTNHSSSNGAVVNVNGLVQQEVDNFLKAHPELRPSAPPGTGTGRSHGRRASESASREINGDYTAGGRDDRNAGSGDRESKGYDVEGWEYQG